MRVLVVHNRYRSSMPSGENQVVDDEVKMLRDVGVEVEPFVRDSDNIERFSPLQKAALAISPAYNVEAVRDFRRVIAERRPDIVHLHNPFPLISPWVVRVAKQAGVPVVQTVHNYRFACPAGTFFRDGRICEDCAGKAFPWPAIQHGCYRGSHGQSLAMSTAMRLHQSTWELVDRFLCVSEFVADKLAASGVTRHRIGVKYNAVADPGPPGPVGDGFFFAGRLSEEKGVRLLLHAWESSGVGSHTTLTIAGDGPLRSLVVDAAARVSGLVYLGALDRDRVAALTRSSRAIVVPSGCYEALPTGALEAFAAGRPVVVTPAGAAATLVDVSVGWVGDATRVGLAGALRSAAVGDAETRGSAARVRFLECFTREAIVRSLVDVYRSVTEAGTHPLSLGVTPSV